MNFDKYIKENFQKENIPILFIGSGITKRYCFINGKEPPSWEELLENIVSIYQNKEFEYNKILNEVKRKFPDISKGILYRKIAQKIEEKFNNAVIDKKLRDKELQEKILNRYRKNNTLSPFKIYLSIFFSNLEITKDEFLLQELKLLKEIAKKSLIIITTNYDPFLEKIFDEYKVITGQELITSKITRKIFKIHGSYTDENSIIITEKDYEKIEQRQKVLNARLITFFAEHPVIFLGYSLNDENIKEFLFNVFYSFSESTFDINKLSNRFIVIERNKDKKDLNIESTSLIIGDNRIEFKKIETNNFKGVFENVLKIPINIDIKEISIIEEIFFKAVKGNKGKKLKFLNIQDIKDECVSEDILIGFGANVINSIYNYSTHINETIEFNSKNIIINPVDFFNIYLPDLRKRNSRGVIPFFKYLSLVEDFNALKERESLKKVYENFKNTLKIFEEIITLESQVFNTVDEVRKSNLISKSNYPKHIGRLFLQGYIKNEDLKNYIHSLLSNNSDSLTWARKLISLYDYKIYTTEKIDKFLKNL